MTSRQSYYDRRASYWGRQQLIEEAELEKQQYVKEQFHRLERLHTTLLDLGEFRTADLIKDIIVFTSEMSRGLTPRQESVVKKLEETYKDVLYDKVKRIDLKHRREKFMERFTKLFEIVKGKDAWLEKFLASIEDQIRKSRPLSDKQKDVLQKAFHRYHIV